VQQVTAGVLDVGYVGVEPAPRIGGAPVARLTYRIEERISEGCS